MSIRRAMGLILAMLAVVSVLNGEYRAAAHDTGHGTADQTAAFAGLAANSSALVVQFNSNSVTDNLYELNPAQGTMEYHSPAEMYTDTGVMWLERIRFLRPHSQSAEFGLHRGDSTLGWNTDMG